ncbi:hypothetical protein ACFSTE_05075 [Aquimarina hainanensis]|uniref:Uncharacterized protein n=1 Tax=Aquimarina hainanensis TaxID=1578017 RepID=A0ABW5N6I1_9FLAO
MNKVLHSLFKNDKKLNLENLDYLIFGRFYSDNYGAYNIYKLTHSALFVDRREIWHNKRHTQAGYTFKGEIMSEEQFQIAKNLINQVPNDILDESLKGFYTIGNKNEDKLILEVSDGKLKKKITIDEYEIDTEELPIELKKFRRLIENKVKQLDRKNDT